MVGIPGGVVGIASPPFGFHVTQEACRERPVYVAVSFPLWVAAISHGLHWCLLCHDRVLLLDALHVGLPKRQSGTISHAQPNHAGHPFESLQFQVESAVTTWYHSISHLGGVWRNISHRVMWCVPKLRS